MSQPGPITRFRGDSKVVVTPALMSDTFVLTLAEVNAGKTIIPHKGSYPGQYRVVGFIAIPDGAFAGLTDIRLSTTEATPVDIATLAVAQLTDGAVLQPGATGVTLGAGFAVALTGGQGIQVRKTGGAGTTATGITVIVHYQLVS